MSTLVSYFGPENTNTHAAARLLYGEGAKYLPELTKTAVFEAVQKQRGTIGVVPIENSTEGVVRETVDGLIRFSPLIMQEFEMDIVHCLLCHRDANLAEVTRVISHPQPLAQCRGYLDKNYPLLPRITAVSTASAASLAADDPKAIAIANPLAAASFKLRVLESGIADRPDNATRFICLSSQDAEPSGKDKTSLVLSTPHEKGALLRILTLFDEANVNLTRIESRPLPDRRWEYAFVVDVEGHRKVEPLAGVIRQLSDQGALRKVLGSYPRLDSGGARTAGVVRPKGERPTNL